jgi:hypothetical protein
MKANMYGAMRAAAYDLLDAIRSAHTGLRCVPPEIAAMPTKCSRQPKWSAASSGASWQPALSGCGPKPLLAQVQRWLTHRSSESGIEEPIQGRLGSFKKARASGFSTLHIARQALALLLALVLLLPAYPQSLVPQNQQDPAQTPSRPPYMQQTPQQLQQLVAPIALYPDSLVAQILAASTFPEQVVEANRWVQSHPDLKGEALAQSVDQMPWDPSVKALVAFPSVLGNMDKNLSWTSSLGDAYYNQEQGIMDAVQVLRRGAQKAGNLNSTEQQTVIAEGSDIQIEPVSPEIVYVPAYDPWNVYGDPIVAWPGWYPYPGIWYDGPALFFGVGFGIGFFGHYDGAGTIGVAIGITTTRISTTRGITHQAGRFITAIDSTGAEGSGVVKTAAKERPSLSAATAGPLAAMPRLTARAAFARAPSAASAMAERNGVFRRAEALALVVEAAFTAVVEAAFTAAVEAAFTVADIADALSLTRLPFISHIQNRRTTDAKNEVEA